MQKDILENYCIIQIWLEDDVSLEGGVGSIDVEKMDLRVIFGNVVKKIKF